MNNEQLQMLAQIKQDPSKVLKTMSDQNPQIKQLLGNVNLNDKSAVDGLIDNLIKESKMDKSTLTALASQFGIK